MMFWPRKEEKPRPKPAATERRLEARLDKVFPVYLEGERGLGMGIARNISTGGLFVETRTPHPIGSTVRVTFVSDQGDLSAVAEVRYVCHLLGRSRDPERGPLALRGMGMRFVRFEDGDGERPFGTVQ